MFKKGQASEKEGGKISLARRDGVVGKQGGTKPDNKTGRPNTAAVIGQTVTCGNSGACPSALDAPRNAASAFATCGHGVALALGSDGPVTVLQKLRPIRARLELVNTTGSGVSPW